MNTKTNNGPTVAKAFKSWLTAENNVNAAGEILGSSIHASFERGDLEPDLNPVLSKLNNDVKASGTPEQARNFKIFNQIKSMVYYQTDNARTLTKVKDGRGFQVSIPRPRKEPEASYAAYLKALDKAKSELEALPRELAQKMHFLGHGSTLEYMVKDASNAALEHSGVSIEIENAPQAEVVELVSDEVLESDAIDGDLLLAINA